MCSKERVIVRNLADTSFVKLRSQPEPQSISNENNGRGASLTDPGYCG